MSSKESNPKMLTKSFRLTASEASRLEEQMRAEDYTNLSKYIRAKVFGDRLASGCVTSFNISFRLSFRCDANFKIPTNSVKTNYKYRIIPYYKTGMQK